MTEDIKNAEPKKEENTAAIIVGLIIAIPFSMGLSLIPLLMYAAYAMFQGVNMAKTVADIKIENMKLENERLRKEYKDEQR